MSRNIETSNAPAPIGPYHQAVKCGSTVFVSGQIPIDPETGKLIDGDIEAQTHQVMKNLKAVIEAAGMDMDHVVKCSIFVTDINDFATVNKVYGGYFLTTFPARETVQVVALPAGAQVEISCIAAT